MRTYYVRVIDTLVTDYVTEAPNKDEAECNYLNGEAEEVEQGEVTDRVIEVTTYQQ